MRPPRRAAVTPTIALFDRTYPPELHAEIRLINDIENPSVQQRRMLKIVDDREVIKKAKYVFKTLLKTPDHDGGCSRLDDFWLFIEAAASLPDQQPYGSRVSADGVVEFPYQNQELTKELESVSRNALKLKHGIPNIAATIAQHVSAEDLRKLIGILTRIDDAAKHECFKLTTRCEGLPVFPDASPQAKINNYSNWIMQKLATLSEIHLTHRYIPFIIEVHRVLLGLNESMAANSARRCIGIAATTLDPDPSTLLLGYAHLMLKRLKR